MSVASPSLDRRAGGALRSLPAGLRGALALGAVVAALGAGPVTVSPRVAHASDGFTALAAARLLDHPQNDGDSFFVEHDGQTWHFRLYFVDCAETSVSTETMARRVRSQTRYFGLQDHSTTVRYGREAARFTREQLARPFTVHTVFASTMGRGELPRHYAFVTTAAGDDLASLLVKNGLARSFGVGRETPDGTSRDEQKALLDDLETAAALARRGIWSEADAESLPTMRRQEREEVRELHAVRHSVTRHHPEAEGLLNINTAPAEALERLPGIGPALAARIIAARPFQSPKDLLSVAGIGRATLAGLEAHISVAE